MDHSYSTKRERIQKVDHCYFALGKKTPKVVLRKAEVLKQSQKNDNVLIGEDHSYHKTNQSLGSRGSQTEVIDNECQENMADPRLAIEKRSSLKTQRKPSFALKVFKSQSGIAEKVIFYVNYFSQNGRRWRIKRTMKKCSRNMPRKVKTPSDPAKKTSNCDDKHSDHSYFSKKYRRTKSLPVLCIDSGFHYPSNTTGCETNSFINRTLSSSPPLSPLLSQVLSHEEISFPSPSWTAFNHFCANENNNNSVIGDMRTISLNNNNKNNENDNNNNDMFMPSQHDHSYLKSPKKSKMYETQQLL